MLNFFYGLIILIVGILVLLYTYKFPNKERPTANIRGWIGGIALVIVGVSLILGIADFENAK